MDIDNLFSTYQNEAFRLETYPEYRVEGEWENFQTYLKSGEVIQDQNLTDYINTASKMIADGRRHIRARLIPEEVSKYIHFEAQVGYIPQSEKGFEFYFLDEDDSIKSLLNGQRDFWLFDKSIVLVMNYSENGEFVSAKVEDDPKMLAHSILIRDYFIENGYDLQGLKNRFIT